MPRSNPQHRTRHDRRSGQRTTPPRRSSRGRDGTDGARRRKPDQGRDPEQRRDRDPNRRRNSDQGRDPQRRRDSDQSRDSQRRRDPDQRRDRDPQRRRNPDQRRDRASPQTARRGNKPPDEIDGVADKAARRTDWGGVARKGASVLRPIPGADRGDAYAAKVPERMLRPPEPQPLPEPSQAQRRSERVPATSQRRRRASSRLDVPDLAPASVRGMPADERERLALRLREAGEDFLAERFGDAHAILRPLASRYPAVSELQELYGLTLYRLGRWTAAAHRLEQYEESTGEVDQMPVLADCYRALGRLNEVHDVWDRLRHADPDAQTITEGRIVTAGALADEGRLSDAIRLLEAGPLRPKRPKEHHLRLWYALADLYDRAGDLQKARRGFARIDQIESGFADVGDRLAALGSKDGDQR